MNYTLYKHIFPNGKTYVGITRGEPKKRWAYGHGYRTQQLMFRAITKYGWNNVAHEVIATGLTEREAKSREIELISECKSNDYKYGYNIAAGGEGAFGYKHTEEARRKMRISATGKKMSPEACAKMSASRTKDNLSDETRKRMSEAAKNKVISDATRKRMSDSRTGHEVSDETKLKIINANKGHGVTLETRRKIGESCKGKNVGLDSPVARPVAQLDQDGNFIKRWDYITQIQESLKINVSNISACCRGRRNKAGGFIWKYANE